MKFALYLLLCFSWVIAIPVEAQIVSTYAGNGAAGYFGDGGAATSAKLYLPTCLAVDAAGNIYITDQGNYCVRKINTAGIITTIAGTGVQGFTGDGGPAVTAKMSDGWGVAADDDGNILIADQLNLRVRKVNAAGVINTIAGTGHPGVAGDYGPAIDAQFKLPIGITADRTGNIFVGDQYAFTIKKIDPAGIITTYAGVDTTAGFSGDGGAATNARFLSTFALSADGAGNLYIADAENNRIRKVAPGGIITTVAGNGVPGFGGDGGLAVACSLNHPTGVFADNAGNILIADSYNNRIRRVNPAGIITTVAGTGISGFSGDGGVCTHAQLDTPTTVVADGNQNIFIADFGNTRIRKISKSVFFTGDHAISVDLCENSLLTSLDSLLAITDGATGLRDSLLLVAGPYHGTAHVTFAAAASGASVTPAGLDYLPYTGFTGNDSFRVVVSNGIMTDTAFVLVHVLPVLHTAGIITGDSTVCARAIIKLSDATSGGIWTVSNLNAIVAEDGIVTGESAGNDTITYTVSNICGAASTSRVVTVYPRPDAGAIAGPGAVCTGLSIVLSDAAPGGYWSATNTLAAINPAGSACVVSAVSAGADTILYTVTDSVCSASASAVIEIGMLPTAAISGGVGAVCAGSALTLTGSPAGGNWYIANQSASFIANGDSILITEIAAGTDTISYSITNFCGTAIASFAFVVDSLPPKPAIYRKEGAVYAAPGYLFYQWTLNGAQIAGAVSDSFVMRQRGYYSVTVSNAYGCEAFSDSVNFPGCSADDIVIYPNPSGGVVHISWCELVTARLLCMDGKTVGTMYNTDELDMDGLPNGVYLLVLYDEHGKKIKDKKGDKTEQVTGKDQVLLTETGNLPA